MTRIGIVVGALLGLALVPAVAQDLAPQVGGLRLSYTLEGPYRWDDAGVAVDGYIVRPNVGGKPDVSAIPAKAMVDFEVCGGQPRLKVLRGSLSKSECPKEGGPGPFPPWVAWRLQGGGIVASEPDGQTKTLMLGEFPQEWRSLLESGGSGGSGWDDVRALSAPSPWGQSLAIIVKPPAGGS